MAKSGKLKITLPSQREILFTREFNAPRHLVFEALTKPELMHRWFDGPPGWTLAVCEVDLRVGGKYRYVWRGKDGQEMGMGGEFLEVVPPERYVGTEKFDQSWYEGDAVGTTVLAEEDGKTIMTLTMKYASQKVRDEVLKSPMEEGMSYGYDRLAEVVEKP